MLTALKVSGNRRPTMLTAGVLLCVLTAPVLGDEIKYLPDNTKVILSVNMPAFLKSKTYQELKKQAPERVRQFEVELGKAIIPLNNIARFTVAWDFRAYGDAEFIVTTVKLSGPRTSRRIRRLNGRK